MICKTKFWSIDLLLSCLAKFGSFNHNYDLVNFSYDLTFCLTMCWTNTLSLILYLMISVSIGFDKLWSIDLTFNLFIEILICWCNFRSVDQSLIWWPGTWCSTAEWTIVTRAISATLQISLLCRNMGWLRFSSLRWVGYRSGCLGGILFITSFKDLLFS